MSKVTFLGCGAMGSRMVSALLQAGHEVVVWNRSSEKLVPILKAGARGAVTPKLACHDAEFVITMVRDDDASRNVWLDPQNGALAGMAGDAIAIESSTTSLSWVSELAEHCRCRNIPLLDAPVVGSRPQADRAQLIFLVGGETSIVAKAEPILRAIGNAVHHTGAASSGITVKLATNALFAVQVATISELIGLLLRAGVDVAKAIEIIATTPVCSPAVKAAAQAMLARDFAPEFPIELAEKDLGYAAAAASMLGALLPVVANARERYIDAIDHGYGSNNITAIAKLYLASRKITSQAIDASSAPLATHGPS